MESSQRLPGRRSEHGSGFSCRSGEIRGLSLKSAGVGRVLDVTGSALRVTLSGWDRVLAVKRELQVPLGHVRGARVVPTEEARRESGVLRAPGSSLPGRFREGTYRSASGDRQFWAVRGASRVLGVELQEETFSRIVGEGEEPGDRLARIQYWWGVQVTRRPNCAHER